MRAAVFHEAHQPMTIETLEVAKPAAHEVLRNTAYADGSAFIQAGALMINHIAPGRRTLAPSA